MVGICRQEDTTGGLLPRKGGRKRACELCPPRPQKHAYEQEHVSHHDCSSATLTTRPRCQLLLAQEGSLYVVLRAPRTWLAVSKTETTPCCTHKGRTHTHACKTVKVAENTHGGSPGQHGGQCNNRLHGGGGDGTTLPARRQREGPTE